MKLFKRVLFLALAASVITGGVLALTADSPIGIFPSSHAAAGEYILSDGKTFSLNQINAVITAEEEEDESSLPAVGNRETLLKLLLDRGALYDASAQNYPYGAGSRSFMTESDGALAAPADSSMPLMLEEMQSAAPEAMTGDAGFANDAPGHSETNEQVEGVSEGDIVKTDGSYIYAMSPNSDTLRIIRADGADLQVVSTVATGGMWNAEFYLAGSDRLVVVGNESINLHPMPVPGPFIDSPGYRSTQARYETYSRSFTAAVIFDITDRSAPEELRRVSMDGWNVSTRIIGSTLYLVTNKNIWHVPYDGADSLSILPFCRDTDIGENYGPIAYDNIFIVPGTDDTSYLLIGAIDIYGEEPFEPSAYFGAGSSFYMSRNAMYVTKTRWEQQSAGSPSGRSAADVVWASSAYKTDILRFAVDGTDVSYTGMGTADGSPINQYSMDEHKGYFRIATTDWGTGTYVTVMSASDMRTVGRTKPLAPDEQMYSARFMGDMGYVVTFHIVDPLFTIDLSDPYNPTVLGELKIPGFSQYLHPVGDGLLMGIGRDTQEIYTRDADGTERVINFIDVGLKVSLFDVSDPFDPREIDVLSLGEGWTEVSYNPRALMTDSRQGLYGFTMESWGSNSWSKRSYYSNDAVLLQVSGGKLSVAASMELGSYYYSYGSRICFIGDTLYVVHSDGVDAYDYTTFAKLSGLRF